MKKILLLAFLVMGSVAGALSAGVLTISVANLQK